MIDREKIRFDGTSILDSEKDLFLPNLDMCFDWVQVTFQGIRIDKLIYDLFSVNIDSCSHTCSGRFGYSETYTVFSKCHVMINRKVPSMGVHILFSGSACREYELCFTWDYFFKYCIQNKAHFTRIDVAIDCFKKYFTVRQLKKKIQNGELVSKFKKSTYITELNISDGSSNSDSLKFGSMSSDVYIVIYDKLAERMNAGYSVKSGISFWTRCEIRFKHDLSDNVAKMYVDNGCDLSKYMFDILYNYLDFKDPTSNKQKSRWPTSDFWKKFLNDCEKQQISVKAFQSTIQQKKEYAESCLYKLMTMLYVCDTKWVRGLIEKGAKNLTKHDMDVINSYMIANNMKIITDEDLEHLLDENQQLELFKALG